MNRCQVNLGDTTSHTYAQSSQLYQLLQSIEKDPRHYADPKLTAELPFPFLGPVPKRFSIKEDPSQGDPHFRYVGREAFLHTWNVMEEKTTPPRRRFYIWGTPGYGKSHILAATACLLMRLGKRTVYFPDCHELAHSPKEYIRLALLQAFAAPEDRGFWDFINGCNTIDEFRDFCASLADRSIYLYFIIDQCEAVDQSGPIEWLSGHEDDLSSQLKDDTFMLLYGDIAFRHIKISCATTDYWTDDFTEVLKGGNFLIPLLGGMTSDEAHFWWQNHATDLPYLTHSQKIYIEDFTGRIPLLLNQFLPMRPDATRDFDSLLRDALKSDYVQHVQKNIWRYARCINNGVPTRSQRFSVAMLESIVHGRFPSAATYDRRYFWEDVHTREARYAGGLVRETIADVLRMSPYVPAAEHLYSRWAYTISELHNNPGVIAFVIKQTCFYAIAAFGVQIDRTHITVAETRTITFPSASHPEFRPTLNLSSTLYIPFAYTFPAVDAVVITLHYARKTATIIPICFSIKEQLYSRLGHKDPEADFYAISSWDRWSEALRGSGYAIASTFLWVVKDRKAWSERSTKRQADRPEFPHQVLCTTFGDLATSLGTRIKKHDLA